MDTEPRLLSASFPGQHLRGRKGRKMDKARVTSLLGARRLQSPRPRRGEIPFWQLTVNEANTVAEIAYISALAGYLLS
jgi:hypothetical protein